MVIFLGIKISIESVRTRIIYRIDSDAIVIADVFMKTTRTTPKTVIEVSQQRFSQYDRESKE